MTRVLILLLMTGTLSWVPAVSAEPSGPPGGASTVEASRTTVGIQLDGRLDEPVWKDATPVTLTQQSPRPGEPTSYSTSVRVLATPDRLYFGFECADPDPRKAVAHTRQRDGEVEGDDSVAVVLDTYGDRKTGYFFRVNFAAARIDGLISDPEHPSTDWDGIWDARTATSGAGWSVEIEIPTRTLSFSRGLVHWGVNFERRIPRDRTVLRWTSPTLDSFFYDLSRAGTLSGLGELQQGIGLDVSPYGVGRMKSLFDGSDRVWQGSPGIDVTYRVAPQMAAVFTVNTDFAETEVDSRQLNVTRFPLFFPERRAFFLEGANQFEFGLGLSGQFIPFFSRRIGLFSEEQVPINAGVKLNGRAGRWNLGILDVQTRDAVLQRTGEVVPATNLFAGRISYDVDRRLRLGTIVTNGNPDGVHENRLAGFDAVWRTSEFMGNKNFLVGGWGAASGGDSLSGNHAGWGLKIDYPNDLWDCALSLNSFGESMDPALGFLPRPGTRRLDASCEFKPRPKKDGPFGWVRQNFMEHRFYHITNYRGEVESWQFWWAPINAEFESGDRFEFNWLPQYEYLPEPFEIAEAVILPVGSYRFDRFRLEFETSPHRPWQFSTSNWFGTFYDGRLFEQETELRLNSPSGSWQAGIGINQNFANLREGSFVQRLWQLDLGYAFSPNVVLTSFLQYDTESQNVGNNMRLRWTFKPGNDLFIVWNRGWKRLYLSPGELTLGPESELLAIKLRWTFRY